MTMPRCLLPLLIGLITTPSTYGQQRLTGISIGQEAPEIAMPNPQGDTLRLSQLRGYVVLVDFWASWCGPCRRENPNVVATYQAYKDTLFAEAQGFRVFNVSLDRKGGGHAWQQAIQQDGLDWPWHVGAVQDGVNPAANTYQVRYIPTNVLVDAQGSVIGVDLHGDALREALDALLETDAAQLAQNRKQRAKAERKKAKAERRKAKHAPPR